MTLSSDNNGPIVVFGEAMIELSDLSEGGAKIDVAGDTFNTAVYMARSGVPVQYATALGEDSFSERIASRLSNEQIGVDYIVTIENKIPGLYAVETDATGERSFSYWRSDSAARYFFEAPEADELLEQIAHAKLFYFSGITLSIFNAAGRKKIANMAEAVRSNGGVVAFDTNYRPNGWKSREEAIAAIEEVMPFISIALPTLEDEIALLGICNEVECIDHWRDAGADEVIVKDGPMGACISSVGWIEPPEIIQPIDTTGAGDSFNGAYLASRLRGAVPVEAAKNGHCLSAKVLMTSGAIIPQ